MNTKTVPPLKNPTRSTTDLPEDQRPDAEAFQDYFRQTNDELNDQCFPGEEPAGEEPYVEFGEDEAGGLVGRASFELPELNFSMYALFLAAVTRHFPTDVVWADKRADKNFISEWFQSSFYRAVTDEF